MIVHTDDDVLEYKGFSQLTPGADRIVIVTIDGESELFAVDKGAKIDAVRDEIDRMYQADYRKSPERIEFYASYDFLGVNNIRV